jgi:nucleoside-diphosphate-sugar epimerase
MNILVTGGTGFSGKALVHRLVKDGHRVIALDYKEGLKTEELKQWGAEVVIGSVTDISVVERCMKGVEVVHHLAAAFRELNVPNGFYEEVNVKGTANVLESAYRSGVKKLIYCSTCGVHGNVKNPPADEAAPIRPADYYQQTKYDAEHVVKAYQEKGLKTVIIRPAAIYGPGDPERFFMIFKRVASGVFPMFGDGRTLYHPLYIDSLTDIFHTVTADGKGDGQTYLAADEHYLAIEELVQKAAAAMGVSVRIPHFPLSPLVAAGHVFEPVCKLFGVKPPIFPRRVDWYRQNRAFSIEKAKKELGYKPQIDIDEGLRRTAQWYRKQGYL